MGRLATTLLLLLVLLSGCWSRIELNDLGVVLGLGVDVGEEEAVRLTLFIPRTKPQGQEGGGGGMAADPVWIVAREAPTLSQALQEIRMASSRRIALYHLRVVVIGEEYARTRGIADILDVLATNPEVRLTVRPFLAEGRAQHVLETMPQLRQFQPNNLVGILQAKNGVDWRLKNILVGRVSETHTTWMYSVKVIDRPAGSTGSPQTGVFISGAAILRQDFLVRFLYAPESQTLAWFLGSPRGATITAPCPDSETGSLSAQVLSGRANMRPSLLGSKVSFLVETEARVNLTRNQCRLEVKKEADRRQLEEQISEDLRSRVEELIDILQETGTDPVGFGKRMQLAYPAYYRTLGDEWPEVWKTASVKVEARVVMPQSGLLTAPGSRTEQELREKR